MEAVPELLVQVAGVMSGFEASWALCGGWSVDAWLGKRTRDHGDVDLTVFRDDQRAVFEYFGTGWLLNGHDVHDEDGTAPWDGRELEFPSHVHAYSGDVHLDIQLNRHRGTEWVFSTKADLTLPVARCISRSAWDLPTLAPEAVLFYKAIGEIRPHDEADFHALAPVLDAGARQWLAGALAVLRPDHAWLPALC